MTAFRYTSILLITVLLLGTIEHAAAQSARGSFDSVLTAGGTNPLSGIKDADANIPSAAPRGGAGTLDPAFGEGGISVFSANIVSGFALQPDGKILTGGNFGGEAAVFRVNPDGKADESFGTDGIVTVDLGGLDLFLSIALQDDGKIVAAGPEYVNGSGDGDRAVLARFLPDGTLDITFGEGGIVIEPGTPESGTPDAFRHVAVRPTGEIVVGGPRGLWAAGTEANECYAVQYLSDGTRDPDFGTDGLVSVVPDEDVFCLDAHLMEDGRYVLGVNVEPAPLTSRWGAVRLLPDGTLDETFGEGGLALTPSALGRLHWTVTVGPDGATIHSGSLAGFPASSLALVRFTSDGALDPGFGIDGVVVPDGLDATRTKDMLFQPDGKIILAGFRQVENPVSLLARTHPDGKIDLAFGPNGTGYTLLDFDSVESIGQSIGLDSENRIVMPGIAEINNTGYVARFENDPAVSTESVPQSQQVALAAPFPNPASVRASLTYTLGEPAPVRLVVYDVLGREVAVLAGGTHAAGEHEVALDAARLAPGLYVVRLQAGSESVTRRLTVVR